MKTLIIRPVSYSDRRLEEIGERIAESFHPIFKNVRIMNGIRYDGSFQDETAEDMRGRLEASAGNSRTFAVSASVMLNWCAKVSEGPTLFVTSFPIVDEKGVDLYGYAYLEHGPALVSVSGDDSGPVGSDRRAEYVQKVGIHEIGHVFGLDDHDNRIRKSQDGFCPMTRAHRRWIESGRITSQEYIELKGFKFCYRCNDVLMRRHFSGELNVG